MVQLVRLAAPDCTFSPPPRPLPVLALPVVELPLMVQSVSVIVP